MHNPSQTDTATRKAWTAPRLNKVGSIADVAGLSSIALAQIPVFRS